MKVALNESKVCFYIDSKLHQWVTPRQEMEADKDKRLEKADESQS